MPDNRPDNRRRTPDGARHLGRTGPGRSDRGRAAAPLVRAGESLPRPRLTGRAAILVLVLAVLAVSYASSMRAYLQQRSHIVELKDQIADRRASIDDLEREKKRWLDPAFVSTQARERFGYVMPGETLFVVLDEDGEPLTQGGDLTDPSTVGDQTPESVLAQTWESVKLAGNPPKPDPLPLTEIDGSQE
ncbi:MAG: septum formation initiator family protein [Nocardioides sp.]